MEKYINLTDYSVVQQVLFFGDALFWVITYILLERNVRKYNFLGIPVAVVIANFAWETVWSWFLVTNLGSFFVWGIRFWFFLDIILVIRMFQLGHKQAHNQLVKKILNPLLVFGTIVCGFLFYFFTKEYSDPIGAATGYAINIIMSILFILLFLNNPTQKALSLDIAVLKMVGTGFVGLGVFLGKNPASFIITLAIATVILDFIYILLLLNRNKLIKQANATI